MARSSPCLQGSVARGRPWLGSSSGHGHQDLCWVASWSVAASRGQTHWGPSERRPGLPPWRRRRRVRAASTSPHGAEPRQQLGLRQRRPSPRSSTSTLMPTGTLASCSDPALGALLGLGTPRDPHRGRQCLLWRPGPRGRLLLLTAGLGVRTFVPGWSQETPRGPRLGWCQDPAGSGPGLFPCHAPVAGDPPSLAFCLSRSPSPGAALHLASSLSSDLPALCPLDCKPGGQPGLPYHVIAVPIRGGHSTWPSEA